jgi:hypothetical protein
MSTKLPHAVDLQTEGPFRNRIKRLACSTVLFSVLYDAQDSNMRDIQNASHTHKKEKKF